MSRRLPRLVDPFFTGGVAGKAGVLLGLVALITLVGAAGAVALGRDDALWWSWTHVLDAGLLSNDGTTIGMRILGTVVSLSGLVIVGGAVLALVEDGARRQLERLFRGSLPKRQSLEGHTVVFGSGRRAEAMVKLLVSQPTGTLGAALVVAVRDPAHLVETKAACGNDARVIVASLTEDSDRKRLRLERCERIIVLDGATVEAGEALASLLLIARDRMKLLEALPTGGRKPIRIHIELAHPELADDLAPALDVLRSSVEILPVAVADASARLALKEHPLDLGTLDGDARVHFIISGWSAFADAAVWQVLRTAHYGGARSTRVLVIDEAAETIERRIRASVAELDKIVEFKAAPFVPDVRGWGTATCDVVTVLACGGSADDAVARALRLRESSIPGLRQVLVEVPDGSGYKDLLVQAATARPGIELHAVGSSARLMDLGDGLDLTARKLHERYRQQRSQQGKDKRRPNSERYLDPADEPWERLDSVRRAWNRASADHADVKLRTLARINKLDAPRLDPSTLTLHVPPGLRTAFQDLAKEAVRVGDALKAGVDAGSIEPGLEKLARMEHDRWMAERRSEGWALSPNGMSKDVERKLSPYLVPYEALEPDVKHYDREAVVEALRPLAELAGAAPIGGR